MTILEGIVVVDLTHALAGPYCTMLLGDLGAEVIKVERPGKGDDTRGWGPPFINGESAYYLSCNRSKKSLTLDLKSAEGKDILKKLILRSDILVENFSPGSMKRLGFDYEKVHEINPRLIYASISGFGQTGPDSNRPGYDLIAQGMGGIMSITGEKDGGPTRVGVAIADIGAGMFALIGILGALYQRDRTGRGQWIDTSLFEGQMSWMTYQAGAYIASGKNPPKLGSAHPTIVPYQTFKAKDHYFNLAAGNDRLWALTCKVMEKEDLIDNPMFKTNSDRVTNREALVKIMNDVFRERPADYWLKKLKSAGVPSGPVYTLEQLFSAPQAKARNMILELEHPTIGKWKMPGNPVKFSEAKIRTDIPPPLLGQHNEEILSSLGYTPGEIEALVEKGVI
ncbi:MAG: CoA transferase [Candidatus Eremiobacteraeota bacterium]|nr:CoA transferase [Candidatus Eremiobacteraeota bacterium]